MEYICLVYVEERQLDALAKNALDARVAECLAYGEEIRKSGPYVPSQALQPSHTATTVRVRNRNLSATDGPFAETKEQLGGFYLIEARDLDEAIRVASKIPARAAGSIEVRPLRA